MNRFASVDNKDSKPVGLLVIYTGWGLGTLAWLFTTQVPHLSARFWVCASSRQLVSPTTYDYNIKFLNHLLYQSKYFYFTHFVTGTFHKF